jgi:hypothetical protein
VLIAGERNAAQRHRGETLYGKLAELGLICCGTEGNRLRCRARYIELRAAITTAIVIAMLLGAAIYQALELERLR